MTRPLTLFLALCVLASAPGCADPPLHVSGIQVGRSLNKDNTIGRFTTTFAPSDTVYVSVATTDKGSGTITVKWSYSGRSLGERSKPVSLKMAGATEFHLESAAGFPPGTYGIEVLLDGKPVATRSFTVAQ